METQLEEYVKLGLKDKKTLTTFSLINLIHSEIKRIKSLPLFEASILIDELSLLIKLKSELLLVLFGLAEMERHRREKFDDEEITEIFSVLQRSFKEKSFEKKPFIEEEDEEEVPILRLSKIVKEILEREKFYDKRELEKDDISIQEISEKIKEMLTMERKIIFKTLMERCKSRTEIVVTFLAVLLLSKSKFLKILQKGEFKEIYLVIYEKGRVSRDN